VVPVFATFRLPPHTIYSLRRQIFIGNRNSPPYPFAFNLVECGIQRPCFLFPHSFVRHTPTIDASNGILAFPSVFVYDLLLYRNAGPRRLCLSLPLFPPNWSPLLEGLKTIPILCRVVSGFSGTRPLTSVAPRGACVFFLRSFCVRSICCRACFPSSCWRRRTLCTLFRRRFRDTHVDFLGAIRPFSSISVLLAFPPPDLFFSPFPSFFFSLLVSHRADYMQFGF